MRDIAFRWAGPADFDQLGEVIFDAVRNGETLYSEAQNAAWVPAPRSGSEWVERLSRQRIAVAVDRERILGFMSLASEGYIDFAFIRPDAQGRGLFRQLFERIEQQAKLQGEPMLWVHASLRAQPAFSAVGFQIREKESVAIGTEYFERFVMEKKLGAA